MEFDEDSIYPDPRGPNEEKAKLGPPDRWLYCPAMGSVVAKHFLPFKTPLCKLYDDQIERKYQFHPRDVFAHKLKGAEPGAKIVLWIDLTKTNRYYSKKEVERRGCAYKKLAMKGHGETPSEEDTEHFCRIVRECLRSNPKGVIAVHCTHGFNRTGFLIAAYLAIELDWAIDAAISNFARFRHNGIYKQMYIDELFKRYGDEEDKFEAPPRPAWETGPVSDSCNPEEEGMESTANGMEDGTSSSEAAAATSDANFPRFMDGAVSSVTYVGDPTTRAVLQNKIREMCRYNKDGFPGSQPVSMERSPERDNLRLIAENPYMVSWKADGLRYMVLINDDDEVYAFDRDNNVFRIPSVTFPHRKESRHIKDTLIDTEIIIDKVPGEDGRIKETPRMLIYDIIKYEGINVGDCDFTTRLLCIQKELIGPRIEALKTGRIRRENEPMSIRAKEFWGLDAVRKLFEDKFTRNVGHEIDGLIFQPVKEPYRAGRCDTLLKWKPPSHNSIDFKLQIRRVCKEGELPEHIGFLYVQHESRPMGEMKATKKLLPYDGKIIECTLQVKTHSTLCLARGQSRYSRKVA
ncbi:mRNA-capping enzyme [Toxocara canis]|uniref:mRNA-capping enzyme n=1 Tax=Toxocara canis TaxID=6265 RepID=A0A0B2VBL0_TOXCA|nr:mRNA-capping enzyme [Toxocara canis]